MKKYKNFMVVGALLGLLIGAGQASAQTTEDRYMGETYMTAAWYCPRGTLELNGQSLIIGNNTALYSLLLEKGMVLPPYGGDGKTVFNLPDMRGRVPVGNGAGPVLHAPVAMGQKLGSDRITLGIDQLPTHNHEETPHSHSLPGHGHTANLVTHSGAGSQNSPAGNSLSTYTAGNIYAAGSPNGGNMAANVVSIDAISGATNTENAPTSSQTSTAGASQTFTNQGRYTGIRFCIVIVGKFPSRN